MADYIDGDGLRERFTAKEIDDLIGADPDADPVEAGNVETLARACSDATSLIDGYLSARYSLPLLAVPSIVIGWAADIARYRLWDDHAPEEVRRRYEDALAQLKLLSQGVIGLPPGSDGVPVSAGIAFAGYSNCRVFTEDTLRGF